MNTGGKRNATASLASLQRHLDALYQSYDAKFLDSDPLSIVREFGAEEDIEVAGFVASSLAYGQVPTILANTRRALRALGESPRDVLSRAGARKARRRLKGFRHRWTSGEDLSDALSAIGWAYQESGSLEGHFVACQEETSDWKGALQAYHRKLLSQAIGTGDPNRRGLKFLLAIPSAGSASKRLCLFLRWMVRRPDGLDFGIWRRVNPADLVIPLDTHIHRIAHALGLTERESHGWAAAEDITNKLRRLDPVDPIKYDFAMCRLGILDHCPKRRDPKRCQKCLVEPVCRL